MKAEVSKVVPRQGICIFLGWPCPRATSSPEGQVGSNRRLRERQMESDRLDHSPGTSHRNTEAGAGVARALNIFCLEFFFLFKFQFYVIRLIPL